MADETTPQWGYSKSDAKIFDLKEGEKLPRGYYDSPAKVPGSEAMKKYEDDAKAEGVGQIDLPADAIDGPTDDPKPAADKAATADKSAA